MKKTTLTLFFFAFAAFAFFAVVSCEKVKDPAPAVTLGKYALTLGEGATETLTADQGVTWRSSDPNIATVDHRGVVTAVLEGVAAITATNDGGRSATCIVTVVVVPADGIGFAEPATLLSMSESPKLQVVMQPAGASPRTLTWKSSKPGVATIDPQGNVTPVAIGKTTVTVRTSNGNHEASCEVLVTEIGVPGFFSDRTWTVGDQTWSDVVIASGCNKTTYNGGTIGGTHLADCRVNTQDNYGHLFSWEAVYKYADYICPEGWHVPDFREFVALDKAMGGEGHNLQADLMLLNKYTTMWGGRFGGSVDMAGDLYNQGTHGFFWSSSRDDREFAQCLTIINTPELNPQDTSERVNGYAVRCVNDAPQNPAPENPQK